MKRTSPDLLTRLSSGPLALAALIIFMLFTILVLPKQSARADANTAEAGTPDLSFYYTPADLYRMAESYGPAGRVAYVQARFTFDVIWPLVYTFFLLTALGWLVRRAGLAGKWWRRAQLLPLWAALFDLLENLSTSLIMVRYPARTPIVDALAPLFTATKWTLIGGSFILLIAALLAALWTRLQARRR